MKWHATVAVIVVCLAGCHAPPPSFDLLAPYGSSRVPPPSTGSLGTGGAYYNRTAPPATSVPSVPNSSRAPTGSQRMQTNASRPRAHLAADDSWKPIRTNATPDPAPAFPGVTGSAANRTLPVSYNGTATGGTALRLNGMPVTDATRNASFSEPARFRPPGDAIEISQLPRATGSSGQQDATGTVVSSAKSSDRIQAVASESSTSKTTLNWRSRAPND